MRSLLVLSLVALLASTASANLLENPGFEGTMAPWGGGGGPYSHADFARPNNETLGETFTSEAFGVGSTLYQETAYQYNAGVEYTFSSWGLPNAGAGILLYELLYFDGSDWIAVASQSYDLGTEEAWAEYAGVTYTPAAGAPELGSNIWVRLGDTSGLLPPESNPNQYDVWVDNAMLTPEPASLMLVGLAGLMLRRR